VYSMVRLFLLYFSLFSLSPIAYSGDWGPFIPVLFVAIFSSWRLWVKKASFVNASVCPLCRESVAVIIVIKLFLIPRIGQIPLYPYIIHQSQSLAHAVIAPREPRKKRRGSWNIREPKRVKRAKRESGERKPLRNEGRKE